MKQLSAFAPVIAVLLTVASTPASLEAALPDDFSDELVAGGLSQPASLDFLPDGRILVTEQNTRNVRLVVNGMLQPGAVLNIPDVQTSHNEQGLLGIAVDPDWPTRPYLYCFFDRTPGSVMYISRFTGSGDLDDANSDTLTFGIRYDILTDIPDVAGNHNGGTLRFGADDMLYASLGDDANQCTAQDSSDLRGVILRMDVSTLPGSGSGPADKTLLAAPGNPYPAGGNPGITYAFGLRNPFRVHVDPWTAGRVLIGDVGQSAYEEMSEATTGGENFGWPFREGPVVRNPGGCNEPGGSGTQTYDDPIAWITHGAGAISIVGGPLYRPALNGIHTFPIEYNGVCFFFEYYSGILRAIEKVGGSWQPLGPVPGQPNGDDWGTNLTNVGDSMVGPDGGLYYLKQFPGELRRIVYTGERTGVPDRPGNPGAVLAAFPNPFRAGEGLALDVAGSGPGSSRIDIFGLTGRRVRTLEFAGRADGPRRVRWDGRDDRGRAVAPGVYYLKLGRDAAGPATRVVVLP